MGDRVDSASKTITWRQAGGVTSVSFILIGGSAFAMTAMIASDGHRIANIQPAPAGVLRVA
jgi:hypothetical protein